MKAFSFWNVICLTGKKVCIDLFAQFLTPNYKNVPLEEMSIFCIYFPMVLTIVMIKLNQNKILVIRLKKKKKKRP